MEDAMSDTLINHIIQLVAGAIGGNGAGAALKNLNLGTTLVPHSVVKYGCITLDSLHNANLATIPTVGRKSLPLFDGLTGRDPLQNGTIENKRKPGSVEPGQRRASNADRTR